MTSTPDAPAEQDPAVAAEPIDEAVARIDDAEARAGEPAAPLLEVADVDAAVEAAPLDAPAPEAAAEDDADAAPAEEGSPASEAAPAPEPEPEPEPRPEPVPTTPTMEELALAVAALDEIAPKGAVGEVLDAVAEGEHVVAIRHASLLSGYPDWTWTVLLSRGVEGGPTVLEATLLPGAGSLLAPAWVPWADRLADYLAAKEAASADGDADDDELEEDLESDLDADLDDDFDDDFDEDEDEDEDDEHEAADGDADADDDHEPYAARGD